jgi:hypothetical protein
LQNFFHFGNRLIPQTLILLLQTLKQGLFETMSTFDSVSLPEGPAFIDMCLINENAFDMLYINDLNGNFRPSNMNVVSTAPAALIASDNNELVKFVNPSKCVSVPTGCYMYCRDTCFRTLRIEIQGPQQATWKLRVCVENITPSKCVFYKAGRRGGAAHTIMAHLPVGLLYDAVVVDKNGRPVVPTFQEAFFEENHCGTTFQFDIKLNGQVGAIPFVPWL